jgi:hypothetical protein
MLTRHNHGVLFRDQASGPLCHICWRWNLSIAIEKDGHLLQSMTSRLRVEEIDRNAEKNKHDDEDEVVFPANAFKSNGIDEGVEEDGHHGSRQSDDEAARTQAVRPDLTRISGLERCPGVPVSILSGNRGTQVGTHIAMS